MSMKRLFTASLFAMSLAMLSAATVIDMSQYGLVPDTRANLSPALAHALKSLHGRSDLVLTFAPGRYDFYPEGADRREYYISNHDQDRPERAIGFALEGLRNITIDGGGAEFVFHGNMLPLALVGSSGCRLSNFSVDFEDPTITQVEVKASSKEEGITFLPAPWVKATHKKNRFVAEGYGREWTPLSGIAFEPDTRRLVYRTSDLNCPLDSVIMLGAGLYNAPRWVDERLKPGTIIALRTYARPAPAIFLSESENTSLKNVKVHFADGMGLLAQLCTNISLDGFSVCLRSDSDPRYFTTQADATHFSGCRGVIDSRHGLYEGMMDDAINVHGTYLRVTSRVDARTVTARYMHHQAYGFTWGFKGDSVQAIRSDVMENVGDPAVIVGIEPVDRPTTLGAKEYRITFDRDLPAEIDGQTSFGLENLTWTPSVIFADNIVRNNRARGALFSTPRPTIVENNTFDHTSGCAILLCGDCNGWYETGACRDVIIRGNTFINALTNQFQFTEAVISIYPEIPALDRQRTAFHGGPSFPGIVIEDNTFMTFDAPLIFAKSVDGLSIRGNKVLQNSDYPAFHPNRDRIRLLKVTRAAIGDNVIPEAPHIDK